jgi:single-stranded-DNA-specific exonuclease
MAAGMSLAEENVEALRARLNENFALPPEGLIPVLKIDGELPLAEITYDLAAQLSAMLPFGKGNRDPLFLTSGLVPDSFRANPAKNMFSFTLDVNGRRKIHAVAFGLLARFQEALAALYEPWAAEKILGGVLRNSGLVLNVVYALEINEYNNQVSVQMRIRDFTVTRDTQAS